MEKVRGSMDALSAMQVTSDMEGLDAQSRTLLRSREILAVILQEVVEEYKGYSREEIMGFIEADSITSEKEVSTGRTNTQVRGDSAEFVQLNEAASRFDLAFRARNPLLSTENVLVNLHIDMEPQKSYRPGYPVEKRGMYYLARRLSSQLTLITDTTDYGQLEKCYSIWICRDDIPRRDRYSISFYEMANTRGTGSGRTKKETYDLMTLVIIRLGDEVYQGKKEDECYGLFRFLNAIMYRHKEDFMETMSEYIDFSDNKELWKEAGQMFSFGQCILEDGIKKGRIEGREEGIQALVLENLDDQIPEERIILKLQKFFSLSKDRAEEYYEKFAHEEKQDS